ncbi:hypothetical protein HYQ46_008965 [Verticillium longisporum]|nr:hypothetical protein HYQ46_008965 [Verticillium longisporum]
MGVASCKRLPCRSPLRDALRLVPGHCPRTPELIARDEPSHRWRLSHLPTRSGREEGREHKTLLSPIRLTPPEIVTGRSPRRLLRFLITVMLSIA